MFGRQNKRQTNQKPSIDICLNDGIQNAANTLLANIRFSSVDEPLKTIAVTSSVPNEGKTTVAVSLAVAIGLRDHTCLIIEGDLRRRSIRGVLGVHPSRGIHGVMTKEYSFNQAVVSTKYQNVALLDAEIGIPNPDGLLSSKRFEELLDDARKQYDYVILDTPPVEAFADASVIASRVDGTVIIARSDYTDKREIAHAVSQLQSAGANLLGVVLNDIDTKSGGYGYYYSYYYDENGNKQKGESAGTSGKKSKQSEKKH